MPRIAGDLLPGSALIIVGAGAIGIISQVEKTAPASRRILESPPSSDAHLPDMESVA